METKVHLREMNPHFIEKHVVSSFSVISLSGALFTLVKPMEVLSPFSGPDCIMLSSEPQETICRRADVCSEGH